MNPNQNKISETNKTSSEIISESNQILQKSMTADTILNSDRILKANVPSKSHNSGKRNENMLENVNKIVIIKSEYEDIEVCIQFLFAENFIIFVQFKKIIP